MIRFYSENDIDRINELGNKLHSNYKFSLDIYSRCLVLENDKISGFITYSVIYDRAEIVDIIIDDSKRRSGYGTMLLKNASDEIKKSNSKNITLEVRAGNKPAIALNEKNGFKIVSTRKKYYNDEDGYLMKLEVK